jgi:hypothetical protein
LAIAEIPEMVRICQPPEAVHMFENGTRPVGIDIWSATITTVMPATARTWLCAEALSKYRIQPGQRWQGDKTRSPVWSRMEFENGCTLKKAVRIELLTGVSTRVLANLMDETGARNTPGIQSR